MNDFKIIITTDRQQKTLQYLTMMKQRSMIGEQGEVSQLTEATKSHHITLHYLLLQYVTLHYNQTRPSQPTESIQSN